MTATILKFPKKKKRQVKKQKVDSEVSVSELFSHVYEDTLQKWRQAAIRNRLNEFVESYLPEFARTPRADYVNDLNVLSQIEQRLGMRVAIFYPGVTKQNDYGWLVGSHCEPDIFSTPPDMVSEANARALNIVLYVEVERRIKRSEERK